MEKKNEQKVEQNKIILAGVIVRLSKSPKVTKLHIATSPSRSSKYRSYPEIVCFKDVAGETKDLSLNDHVEIECSVQTVPYSKRRSDNIKSYLVAKSIKKSESKLSEELGLKSTKGVYDDKNEGIIAGEVVNVFVMSNGKDVIITVRARANGRVSLPAVACFGDISKQVMTEQVKKGDIVAMSCFVNTGKDKNDVYHESLVAREFSLIERA